MKDHSKKGKVYKKPAITRELELETRAGTPLAPGPFDLPGSGSPSDGG